MVLAADQQNVVWRALEANKAGLHTAFGRTEGCQTGVLLVQQHEVVGQLAMEETGSIITLHTDDAQMRNRSNALKGLGHG